MVGRALSNIWLVDVLQGSFIKAAVTIQELRVPCGKVAFLYMGHILYCFFRSVLPMRR